ncbi:MAG: dihydrolipoamide acetyltransferase family protein [Bacteroidota bacterium]
MSIIKATPAARRKAIENKVDLSKLTPRLGLDYLTAADVTAQNRPYGMTHLAKNILDFYKTDPQALGINIEGKLNKNIALQALEKTKTSAVSISSFPMAQSATRKPMTGMRKTIAAKMTQSLQNAAQYTLFVELNAAKLKSLSSEISSAEQEISGNKINITDILIKITATALVKHPLLNTSVGDNEIIFHDRVNIGLAVALNEGLIVPVIQNVAEKNLRQISEDRQSLVGKARKGTLQPDEYTGGTFTISNMGMYPVDFFTPIINQPENAILGIGRITEKAVPIDGKIEIRPMIGLSLTMDHRVIDGAEGAKFLNTFREMLDNPARVCLSWY